MSIWRYTEHLPDLPADRRITLGEGGTPLVRSRRIGPLVGLDRLYFKLETGNPSGSYKDRFAAAAVSDMVARGIKLCIATSSGNTGAALAAYCAAAGVACRIAIVETAPAAKLRQMQAYGAGIFRIRAFGLDDGVTRDVVKRLEDLADGKRAALLISAYRYCPAGMRGVETLASELNDQLPGGIGHVFCQAGGGGLTLAMVRGFQRLQKLGRVERVPAVECVQPEGNDTMAGPLREGLDRGRAVRCTTHISGLQVPSVIDADEVIAACRSVGGTGHLVADAQVYAAQARLAREEGIFSEPAGAVPVAGAIAAARAGLIRRDDAVVCTVTGIGFKDEASLSRLAGESECPMLETPEEMTETLRRSRVLQSA